MAKIIPFKDLSPFAQKVYITLKEFGLAVSPIEPETSVIKQRRDYKGISLPSGYKYYFSNKFSDRSYFTIKISHKGGTFSKTFDTAAQVFLYAYLLAAPVLFAGPYEDIWVEPWPGLETKPFYLYFWSGAEDFKPVIFVLVSNLD
jgi:hypothetical protein